MLGQGYGSSRTAILVLGFPEQVTEWHLEGHGDGYQGGHCNVRGPLLHLDDVLRVDANGLGGLLLSEPPFQAELPKPISEAL